MYKFQDSTYLQSVLKLPITEAHDHMNYFCRSGIINENTSAPDQSKFAQQLEQFEYKWTCTLALGTLFTPPKAKQLCSHGFSCAGTMHTLQVCSSWRNIKLSTSNSQKLTSWAMHFSGFSLSSFKITNCKKSCYYYIICIKNSRDRITNTPCFNVLWLWYWDTH